MLEVSTTSEDLLSLEPYLEKYYDYHPSMLYDEIKRCVENSGIDYIAPSENGGLPKIDFDKTFREHKDLKLEIFYSYNTLPDKDLSEYFQKQDNGNIVGEDAAVWYALIYMSYIYHKEKNNVFQNSILISDLNLEYEYNLNYKIYPEMLSLYKMILESKNKRNRSSKVTITYKQAKLNLNSCSWFIDDMEKYFADRFSDLTLEEIDNILFQHKGKSGRKFNNPTITIMMWGTYHLAKNHLSKFKESKVKISSDICKFIYTYLHYLDKDINIAEYEIREALKDMMKRNYTPKWSLPWRNVFTNIEKQPQTLEELNQPQRYDIHS